MKKMILALTAVMMCVLVPVESSIDLSTVPWKVLVPAAVCYTGAVMAYPIYSLYYKQPKSSQPRTACTASCAFDALIPYISATLGCAAGALTATGTAVLAAIYFKRIADSNGASMSMQDVQSIAKLATIAFSAVSAPAAIAVYNELMDDC